MSTGTRGWASSAGDWSRKPCNRLRAGAGFYLLLWMSGCFLLCFQGWPLVDSLVESASAIGTVGLSRNLTPQLDVISQWVVMLLMYGGRVGSLSVVLAFSPQQAPKLKNPTEKVIIG